MRATLAAEVGAFLREKGPTPAPEIAMAVRARRVDVDAVLATAAFVRVPPPEGASPRAAYFMPSGLVQQGYEPVSVGPSDTTDKAYLLAVLADGEWHTLTEILARSFRDRGCGLTVHSRAAELRPLGYVIENRTEREPIAGPGRRGFTRAVSSYRLVARAGSPRALAGAPDESAEAA